jgi:hypothetical protein
MKMNNDNKKSIPFEEALQMPELSHLHDMMRYLENAHDSDIMPEKYEQGLEYLADKKTRLLFNENAMLPLKNVVSIVLERLPNDVPALFLVKITQFIILQWGKLWDAAYQKERAVMVA